MADLCCDCSNFDLHSFREDRYMQRRYMHKEVCERAATCSFCRMLQECLGEQNSSTPWVHLELLARESTRVKRHADPLRVMYIRAFLGDEKYIRCGPNTPEAMKDVMLYVCADQGTLGLRCESGVPKSLLNSAFLREPCGHQWGCRWHPPFPRPATKPQHHRRRLVVLLSESRCLSEDCCG